MMRLFLLLLLLVCAVCAKDRCRFAAYYDPAALAENATLQAQFVSEAFAMEAEFMRPGVGVEPTWALTYNGRTVDYATGDAALLWDWTAASKEALHLNVLALALVGAAPQPSRAEAVDQLARKIRAYAAFDARLPGYGGFLPWFVANASGIVPTQDWSYRVPSLDNGQLAWSMVAAARALRRAGETALAAAYEAYVSKLAANVLTIFHEGRGRLRTVANIRDVHKSPTPDNYYGDDPCGDPCFLDDPYEGELLAWFADLRADWRNASEREEMWVFKRAKLQPAEYATPNNGPITVQRGWWFSAHEQWKYMYLPYNQVDIARRVQVNCERARTWHSFLKEIPGLYACITEPCTPKTSPCPFNYIGAGIQEIAFEPVPRKDVVTPYGAFPTILADRGAGLAWLATMLQGRAMQGPLGSTESAFINGAGICPCLTWDSKITTTVAMLGGIVDLTAEDLQQRGLFGRFKQIVEREYSLAFSAGLKGEHLPFKLPSAKIPALISDFSHCTL